MMAVAQPVRALLLYFKRGLLSQLPPAEVWPYHAVSANRRSEEVCGFLQTFPFIDNGRVPVDRINFVLVT